MLPTMHRAIAAAFAAALALSCGTRSTQPARPVLPSVQPAVARMTTAGRFSCTAWHLAGGRWISAGHCCARVGARELDGKPAEIVRFELPSDWVLVRLMVIGPLDLSRGRVGRSDLCELRSPAAAVALSLGEAPTFHDPLTYVGWPADQFGAYSGVQSGAGDMPTSWPTTDLMTGHVRGGASGSPVLDANRRVVGVLVAGSDDDDSILYERLSALRAFIAAGM